MKLSALVPTFNEEKQIEACLESLSFCDEIVLVDSFSTDRTVELAARYTDRIFQRPWKGSNDQKDFARRQARGEWVLSVDADERVTDRLRDEILRRLDDPRYAGYELPIRTYLGDRWIRVGGLWPGYHLRLFRRQAGYWDPTIEPHERVVVEGRCGRMRGHLEHPSYEDLQDLLSKARRDAKIWASTHLAAGRSARPLQLITRPAARFLRDYVVRGGFLQGGFGLLFCCVLAHYTFLKYLFLWEAGISGRPRR